MRRKSERNKGKSSPEKKVEKPTRKSSRRRAKKSPSTSPERSKSPDGEGAAGEKESNVNYKVQTRLANKEVPETIVEEPESKVSSTDQVTGDLDDAGCVWKVARADASPGEIQKLKLCRQRNLSETSDASLSRKRVSKWQEGEGNAEEADSADERPATSNDKTDSGNIALADDTSSTTERDRDMERESGEEVSDSKEIPPETTVDLSDVKPNIDQGQAESQAEQPERETVKETTPPNKDDRENSEARGDDANVSENMEIAEQEVPEAKEVLESRTSDKEEKTEEDVKDKDIEKSVESLKTNEKDQEEGVGTSRSTDLNESGKDPSDSEEKPRIEEEKIKNSSENSTDENVRPSRTRSVRRKHRDKYQDSSNSDTGETDEEEEEEQDEKKVVKEEEKRSKKKGLETEEEKDKRSRENSPEVKVEVESSKKDEGGGEVDKQEVIISSAVGNDTSPVREEKQTNICRPAKVNLKRAFTSRISAEELKKDDAGSANDASQDKENHVTDESKSIPKRRRWGTAFSTDIAPVLSISTDSLKALVPGAKPLSIKEVRLSKDDDEDRDRRKDKRQVANDEDKSKADHETKNDSSKDNHMGARRKISIVKDTPQLSSSPPVAQPTSILLIKNLVRPFTLNQIKELLSRTGTIVENGFWIDRIKSKCFVEYANEDQAFETRQALHGISWPTSNPKKIQVEYSAKEEMEKAKESSKDQPLSRKLEASSGADAWQQDWGRDEKSNAATKVTVVREWDLGKEDGQHLLLNDKEKETKDRDKKRRQARSRSPTLEAHLPAPARKFKKKEDEPPPAKLLDDLFRKTKAAPCIYWLPLTNEQIVVKEEMRRQHMAEHARRLEEMRRAERNRDGHRRRSPRK
ncbi:apoptotic chromatin condensation inducer in the nucleus [Diachasmimorpha longicaudata]|uniref:apoptotic chromatin condensation inducer in the nucleus n=1 Tax=Diachasmimorpha longicaudata TaxID=58733 RepID=UPI0030B8FD4A